MKVRRYSWFSGLFVGRLALTFSGLLGLCPKTSFSSNAPAKAVAVGTQGLGSGFVENKGQWHKDYFFRHTFSTHAHLFVQQHGWYYFLTEARTGSHAGHAHQTQHRTNPEDKGTTQGIIMRFVSANKAAHPQGMYGSYTRYNFFLGKDPKRWASNARAYEEIWYCDLYEGIDLMMKRTPFGIKYNLYVRPGADLSKVSIQVEGTKPVLKNNQLTLPTIFGPLSEHIPKAYLVRQKDTLDIACQYVWKDKNTLGFRVPSYDKQTYELVIDPELEASTLTGSSASNWGNTACSDQHGNMYAGGIIFGWSSGILQPQVGVAYQPWFRGQMDVLITKFSPDGRQLIYATYLGGSDREVPVSMIVNDQDELFVLGPTGSRDFPITIGAYDEYFGGGKAIDTYQIYYRAYRRRDGSIFVSSTRTSWRPHFENGSDLYVVKLSPSGGELLGSTYLGGSENDGLLPSTHRLFKNYGDGTRGELYLDTDGHLLIASHTFSLSDFPLLSPGVAHFSSRRFHRVESKGVLVKMTEDLSTLMFSLMVGGDRPDALFSVRSNHRGYYAVGSTGNGPVLRTSSLASVIRTEGVGYGSDSDAFVMHIPKNGSEARVTVFGTAKDDQGYLMDLDNQGNVYVTGQTRGDYPVRGDVFSHGTRKHFIQKFDADLSHTLWSTAIGGRDKPQVVPTAFLVSDCGQIYFCGWGGRSNIDDPRVRNIYPKYDNDLLGNLPITSDAYKRNTHGSNFYLMLLSPDAKRLVYGTYFGGNSAGEHVDGGVSRFDKSGAVYQAVCSNCGKAQYDFPTTSGAFSSRDGSDDGCNMAVFKFDVNKLEASFRIFDQDKVRADVSTECAPFTALLSREGSSGRRFYWNFDSENQTRFQQNDSEEVLHTFDKPGSYVVALKVVDPGHCDGEVIATKRIVIQKPVPYTLPEDQRICEGERVLLEASADSDKATFFWAPSRYLSDQRKSRTYASPPVSTDYYLQINLSQDCIVKHKLRVEVVPKIQLSWKNVHNPILSCQEAQTFRFSAHIRQATTYEWDMGDGTPTSTYAQKDSLTHTYAVPGPKTIVLRAQTKHCHAEIRQSVYVHRLFVPNVFTPNGDGQNDYFVIDSPERPQITIANRNGNTLLKRDQYHNDWNAADLPSDVYFYRIHFPDHQVSCKGWVHVLK